MGSKKDTEILSASEIGQYQFFYIAWHLQRAGHEPKSPMLEVGTKKHSELGKIIDQSEINRKRGNLIGALGYILLIFAIIIIIFGVII